MAATAMTTGPVPPDPVPPITPAAIKANDALVAIAELATEAQPPAVRSPSGSFKGWLFGTWLRKNKERLKNIVSLASGGITAWIAVHLVGTVGLLVGALVSLATSFILDGIDFFFTKDAA
jgi:hypothetical protein